MRCATPIPTRASKYFLVERTGYKGQCFRVPAVYLFARIRTRFTAAGSFRLCEEK
jgi:hypothetical protein